MKLFLFDIDGTLINSGGSGKYSLNTICEKFFNISNCTNNIHIQGRSDKAIWAEIIDKFNIQKDKFLQLKPILFREYYKTLNNAMKENNNKIIYPNVKNTLKFLQNKGHKLGLVTGNLKKGAYIKISYFNIEKFFPIGGFGDDSENRNEIVKIAVKRAKKYYNYNFKNNNIFIIGDTPADIKSALENGLIAVAITTGYHNYTELIKYKPHYIFSDIKNLKDLIN